LAVLAVTQKEADNHEGRVPAWWSAGAITTLTLNRVAGFMTLDLKRVFGQGEKEDVLFINQSQESFFEDAVTSVVDK
jgi:hypothetical protein